VTTSDFIWQAAFILAFGAGGAAVCRARLKGQSVESFQMLLRKTRHLYLVFPLLLVFPFINVYLARDPSLQWDMPEWLQLHWAALSWGIVSGILSYLFGFCSMAAFAIGGRWKWWPIYFGAVVVAAIQVYAGWSSRPNLPSLVKTRISSDGVILQTSAFTCVPAAGANIAAILGIHTTEREMAELFHTTRDGTFPAQALHGMKELGISGRKVTASSGIRTVTPPAMLFVMSDTHAVVYAGMKGGLVEIWNPNNGKRLMPESQLSVIWAGHALEFERAQN
jgi:Peptidase C39 family